MSVRKLKRMSLNFIGKKYEKEHPIDAKAAEFMEREIVKHPFLSAAAVGATGGPETAGLATITLGPVFDEYSTQTKRELRRRRREHRRIPRHLRDII